jgi:membrane-associated phospholipid phosphatase
MTLLKSAFQILKRQKVAWLVSATLLAVVLIFAVLPQDDALLKALRNAGETLGREKIKSIAGALSYWGDFGGYSVILAATLFGLGLLRKSTYLQRLAMASLLAALLAGTAANVMRMSLGRPRPRSGLADGLYGPSLKSELHALPSAHTATAFGSSIPILVAAPYAGVPLVVFASGVSWSRMQLNQHHPVDIAIGIWFAALFGVPLGLAVKKLRADD